jgi:C_GCAxxG_C_C family probable redox protein
MDEKKNSLAERAIDLFNHGYSCSQAVVGAFCEETGMDFETAMKLTSSFGAGMGRLREVCGAVTGMFMVAGLLYGFSNPANKEKRVEHYKLIQSLAQQFKDEYGSIICRELTGLSTDPHRLIPEERKGEYAKKRSCVEMVGQAATMLEEMIKAREE